MTPTLIITRPAHVADQTVRDYRAAISRPFDVILSPLIEIVPCAPPAFPQNPDHVIFTSANAVAQVDRIGLGRGAIAWCVGARTAQAAQDAGFRARSVNGAGRDLLALLQKENLSGTVLHVHGRHTHVDFAQELKAPCQSICVYEQVALEPSAEAICAFAGTTQLIVPLYSPNTLRTLVTGRQILAPAYFVAISKQVALLLVELQSGAVYATASTPDHAGTIDATRIVFEKLLFDTMP